MLDGYHALPQREPTTASGDPPIGTILTRLWPIFALSWPMFVLTGPVPEMVAEARTPAGIAGAVAWTVAFLTCYGWLTMARPFRTEVTHRERRLQVAFLMLLTGLVAYRDVGSEPGYFWLFIAANIAAGVVLPTRAAAWTVAAITALAMGIDAPRIGWSVVTMVPGIAIWGLAAILLRKLVLIVDVLQQAREERAQLAVAEERLRFARDLHDLLGHSLSLIALKSELARRLIPADADRAGAEIRGVEQVARRALRDVREAVTGYRQPSLDEALTAVREMLDAAGITASIDTRVDALPPALDAVLAWTIREGATNVVRHSHARTCRIHVEQEGDVIQAAIIDDGCGIASGRRPDSTGNGLSGIVERVARFGGKVLAGGSASSGFALRVTIPHPASAQPARIGSHGNGAMQA